MEKILQLKVSLQHIKPLIWRRIEVENTITLFKMHHIIQISMGWWNYHLYEFNVNDKQIGNIRLLEEENIIDDRKVKLGEIFTKEKIRIQYEYDFGDCWEHIIELEKILPKEKNKKYPVCTDGERNCPHEDCGGVGGYYEYVKIIKNKNHPEYREMMQWLGSGKFDPEYFNIKEKNKELRDLENYIKGYKD